MEIEREVSYRVALGDRVLRRGAFGGWEELYGMSWEAVNDDSALEAGFQEAMAAM